MSGSTNPDGLLASLNAMEPAINRLESIVASWTRRGDVTLSFDLLKADQAYFYNPPVESVRLLRSSNQNLGANVWNTLVWDTVTYNTGLVGYSTGSTGIIYAPQNAYPTVYLFIGFVVWTANSSGERLFRFNELTTDGPIPRMISDAPPLSGIGQWEPFAFAYKKREKSSGFNFQLWQNGAPDVDLDIARMNIIKLAVNEVADSTKTFITTPPTQSNWVYEGAAGTDMGNSSLYVRTVEDSSIGAAKRDRSFVQFNLSGIPSGADIVSATLHLFQSGMIDNTSAANSVEVYRVATPWSTGLTWNTQPGVVSTKISSGPHPTGTTGADVEFILSTAEFAAMISSNYGMRLSLGNEDIGSTNVEYSRYAETAAEPYFGRRPKLVVKYVEA